MHSAHVNGQGTMVVELYRRGNRHNHVFTTTAPATVGEAAALIRP